MRGRRPWRVSKLCTVLWRLGKREKKSSAEKKTPHLDGLLCLGNLFALAKLVEVRALDRLCLGDGAAPRGLKRVGNLAHRAAGARGLTPTPKKNKK